MGVAHLFCLRIYDTQTKKEGPKVLLNKRKLNPFQNIDEKYSMS